MRGSLGYPKTVRLRRRRDFLEVQSKGRRRQTPHFVVIRRPARMGVSRLGVTVSSRIGIAVCRSRVKRLVREIFRQARPSLHPTSDIVIIARPGAPHLSYAQVATEIDQALELAPRS